MATISEDYVSFETAKLLKKKGFDQNCATYYLDGQVLRHYHGEVIPKGKQIYAAPTQAMAMKWLREVHHIFIQIELYSKYDNYNFEIFQNTHRLWIEERTVYSTYTETVEMAIKYTLEHLI